MHSHDANLLPTAGTWAAIMARIPAPDETEAVDALSGGATLVGFVCWVREGFSPDMTSRDMQPRAGTVESDGANSSSATAAQVQGPATMPASAQASGLCRACKRAVSSSSACKCAPACRSRRTCDTRPALAARKSGVRPPLVKLRM